MSFSKKPANPQNEGQQKTAEKLAAEYNVEIGIKRKKLPL